MKLMPTNRVTMRRIRETLRLHLQAGLSYGEVGRALKIAKSSAGKYVSLGAFSPAHVGNAGFGFAGLLRMYGASTNTKLYVALAGSIEPGNNNFQLYLDLPSRSGVPVGTGLPDVAGTATV